MQAQLDQEITYLLIYYFHYYHVVILFYRIGKKQVFQIWQSKLLKTFLFPTNVAVKLNLHFYELLFLILLLIKLSKFLLIHLEETLLPF